MLREAQTVCISKKQLKFKGQSLTTQGFSSAIHYNITPRSPLKLGAPKSKTPRSNHLLRGEFKRRL
ncbi:hypothetical protein EEJ34_05935 [Vibrio cholerae]|nr:hypothetical protein EEJ34_05935 [Vibrio cholerae]